jgi:hypothetical protein
VAAPRMANKIFDEVLLPKGRPLSAAPTKHPDRA